MPPTPNFFSKIFGFVFSMFLIFNPRISPREPQKSMGDVLSFNSTNFHQKPMEFQWFHAPKTLKTPPPKNLHQNVSNFSDPFWQPPGPGTSAHHFPRSKYSSLKVSDYLQKPCFFRKNAGRFFEKKYIKIRIFWDVFHHFWYTNRGFRARDLSPDLRLEIPLRMVKFSFQNSLMAPSYDPNTGPKNAAKNHDHA